MAGLRGVAEEAESGWAGIPGLVSPRFPGAGSPWSLRIVMGRGCARKGLPVPPPVLLRTTCVEAQGVSRRDRRGDGRLGGGRVEWGRRSGVPGEGELGQDWRELGVLQKGRGTEWGRTGDPCRCRR